MPLLSGRKCPLAPSCSARHYRHHYSAPENAGTDQPKEIGETEMMNKVKFEYWVKLTLSARWCPWAISDELLPALFSPQRPYRSSPDSISGFFTVFFSVIKSVKFTESLNSVREVSAQILVLPMRLCILFNYWTKNQMSGSDAQNTGTPCC